MANEVLFTREELRPCDLCGKGLMHGGIPIVWRMRLERIGVDFAALRREDGLERMMGAAAPLARVFSPDRDFGKMRFADVRKIICEPCILKSPVLSNIGLSDDGESAADVET